MTEQSCRNCDYFTLELLANEITSHGHGWCWWATRHPVPYCYSQSAWDTWANYGENCPCWRPTGYIDAFLAEAPARRAQEPR